MHEDTLCGTHSNTHKYTKADAENKREGMETVTDQKQNALTFYDGSRGKVNASPRMELYDVGALDGAIV